MAKSKRKKKNSFVRFELSFSGLLGVIIVSFCIFLWMFLLGIWSGQTILLPNQSPASSQTFGQVASSIWQKGKEAAAQKQVEQGGEAPSEIAGPEADDLAAWEAEPDFSEPSFFALQIAAISDPERAARMVTEWQSKGYDAFSLPPDGSGDGLHRVCVGKFDELAAANLQAGKLEEQENVRAYITLVPVSRIETR